MPVNTAVGGAIGCSEVARDRLWRDHVSREAGHQRFWAVESPFIRGGPHAAVQQAFRPVSAQGDDPARAAPTAPTGEGLTPAGILLQQLAHVDAAERSRFQQLRRTINKERALQRQGLLIPTFVVPGTSSSPRRLQQTAGTSAQALAQREQELARAGGHRPAAKALAPLSDVDDVEDLDDGPGLTPTKVADSPTASRRPAGLPPLHTSQVFSGTSTTTAYSAGSATMREWQARRLEEGFDLIEPTRSSFSAHGLLSPHMSRRVRHSAGTSGYGSQTIHSSTQAAHTYRSQTELPNEFRRHFRPKFA